MSVTDTIVKATVFDIPNASKLVDLKPEGEGILFPEVISFNYYEAVLEDFITADLTILDSAGLVDEAFNKCGVRQFCPVTIEFSDPSKGTDWEKDRTEFAFTGDNCFYVNRVVNQGNQRKEKAIYIRTYQQRCYRSII